MASWKWSNDCMLTALKVVQELAKDGAAKNGYLEVIKWLYANRSEGCTNRAIIEAAEHTHPIMVIHDGFHPPNQFEMILFLHEGYPHLFGKENWEISLVSVATEPNDEHVKVWIQMQYSEAIVMNDLGMDEW
ncbi:hypothetical protein PC123_g22557 [Phytophthora cactorum]|nr:hypothetical protein PC123_g22557 [Phytophthora cactorum]